MTFPRRRWSLAVGLLAVVGVVGWIAWSSQPVDPETEAVRTAAEGAIRTLSLDDAPPLAHSGGPLPATAAAQIKDRLIADLHRYFTLALQARYTPLEFSVVDQMATGFWDTGDLSIGWGRASINGDLATISFDEHETLVRHFGDRSNPATLDSTWHVQMSLVRQDGRWQVATYETDCSPNCP